MCQIGYVTARRLTLGCNGILLIMALVLIIVAAGSVAVANSFAGTADDYCKEQCALTPASFEVGCDCKKDKSTLTAPILMAPGIGGIVLAILLFLTTCLGFFVMFHSPSLIRGYLCALTVISIMQLGFASAAVAVATANSREITGPIYDVMRVGHPAGYKRFDWKFFESLWDKACYAGEHTEYDVDSVRNKNVIFHHPNCDFDGGCVIHDPNSLEEECCLETGDEQKCDTSKKDTCIAGKTCVDHFLRNVGASVATASFIAWIVELVTIMIACSLRSGPPGAVEKQMVEMNVAGGQEPKQQEEAADQTSAV